jgi:hypothetical protein
MLTGCGGSQQPGAMPQTPAIATQADRSGSWMLPEAKGGDLIYAAAPPDTVILSYPRGKLLAKIKNVWGSMCSDANGDVFMAGGAVGTDEIFEYAHGGTSPIAMLTVPSQYGLAGCAIDPTTGNLAASGYSPGGSGGVVAIFQNAQGNPQIYINENARDFYYCGYDDKGNLFVHGIPTTSKHFIFSELPKASGTFTDIQLPPSVVQPLGTIQWDGAYITDENPAPTFIYRISVSGSVGTIVGTTQIGNKTRFNHGPLGSWIQGNRVIAPQGRSNGNIAYWNYPAGGNPVKIIKGLLSKRVRHKFAYVTISIAPSLRPTAKSKD